MTYLSRQLQDAHLTLVHGMQVKHGDSMFRAGSVVGYAIQSGEDPYLAVVRNEKHQAANKWTQYKTHWLNAEAVVICAYKWHHDKTAAERKAAPEVAIGQVVVFDGRLWKISSEPNRNLGLVALSEQASIDHVVAWHAANKAVAS